MASNEGGRPQIIAIGASTGGPNALAALIGALHRDVRLPIIIAQHMPAKFTEPLARRLAESSDRPAAEARDGEAIAEGRIYVAPGDRHLIVDGARTLRVTKDDKVNFCRPSIDVTFRSVAKCYGAAALAVVLTGMGEDGLAGAREIAEQGGTVLAQDEESSVVWGIPGAVAAAGIAECVASPPKLAAEIWKRCLTRARTLA